MEANCRCKTTQAHCVGIRQYRCNNRCKSEHPTKRHQTKHIPPGTLIFSQFSIRLYTQLCNLIIAHMCPCLTQNRLCRTGAESGEPALCRLGGERPSVCSGAGQYLCGGRGWGNWFVSGGFGGNTSRRAVTNVLPDSEERRQQMAPAPANDVASPHVKRIRILYLPTYALVAKLYNIHTLWLGIR